MIVSKMSNRIVDPPEGWRFGFPKGMPELDESEVEQWFIDQGYPKLYIEKGYLNHCRYFIN